MIFTGRVERESSDSFYLSGEWPRLPSTARMERAHSYRARTASKEGTWLLPPHNAPNVRSKNCLVRVMCCSMSDCKSRAPAFQSSFV